MAQMIADQIQIANKPAILPSQAPIDAAVLQCAEDAAGELRARKQLQRTAIIDLCRIGIPACPGVGR